MIDWKHVVIALAFSAAACTVGYAVYFDHKRRRDPAYRKALKKQNKKLAKDSESEPLIQDATLALSKKLAELYKKCDTITIPTSSQERDSFFMNNLQMGETLAAKGPKYEEEAVIYLFTAVKMCPSPAELVEILAKVLPATLMDLLYGLFAMEMKMKAEKYYELYPDSTMNVKFAKSSDLDPKYASLYSKDTRALVSLKDFSEGETIYVELPTVCSLSPSLEGLEHCSKCLRVIRTEQKQKLELEDIKLIYCSEECKKTASDEIFISKIETEQKSAHLYKYCHQENVQIPVLISRFLTKLFVNREISLALGGEEPLFNDMDHLNKLEQTEIKKTDSFNNELEGLQKSLSHRIPSVEEIVNADYYIEVKGRFSNNVIGICASEDFVYPADKEGYEDIKKLSPGPFIGTGLYLLSAYLKTSDELSNSFVSFTDGNKLNLIAQKPIKKGDIIIVRA